MNVSGTPSYTASTQNPSAQVKTADASSCAEAAPPQQSCCCRCSKLPVPSAKPKSLLETVLNAFRSAAPQPRTLNASFAETGELSIATEDGYSLRFSGKRQEWTISDPQGNHTRIWGDPHVAESDGDNWDFNKTSSFLFGNNKITVETTPYEKNPDMTVTKTVTIYNGRERFSVTDIDIDKPKLERWTFDASAHDEGLDDGTAYTLLSETLNSIGWNVEQR